MILKLFRKTQVMLSLAALLNTGPSIGQETQTGVPQMEVQLPQNLNPNAHNGARRVFGSEGPEFKTPEAKEFYEARTLLSALAADPNGDVKKYLDELLAKPKSVLSRLNALVEANILAGKEIFPHQCATPEGGELAQSLALFQNAQLQYLELNRKIGQISKNRTQKLLESVISQFKLPGQNTDSQNIQRDYTVMSYDVATRAMAIELDAATGSTFIQDADTLLGYGRIQALSALSFQIGVAMETAQYEYDNIANEYVSCRDNALPAAIGKAAEICSASQIQYLDFCGIPAQDTDPASFFPDGFESFAEMPTVQDESALRFLQVKTNEKKIFAGNTLMMQSDGNLTLTNSDGVKIWETAAVCPPERACDNPMAFFQRDGNLVVYADNEALWSSETYTRGHIIKFTPEGFNILNRANQIIFNGKTDRGVILETGQQEKITEFETEAIICRRAKNEMIKDCSVAQRYLPQLQEKIFPDMAQLYLTQDLHPENSDHTEGIPSRVFNQRMENIEEQAHDIVKYHMAGWKAQDERNNLLNCIDRVAAIRKSTGLICDNPHGNETFDQAALAGLGDPYNFISNAGGLEHGRELSQSEFDAIKKIFDDEFSSSSNYRLAKDKALTFLIEKVNRAPIIPIVSRPGFPNHSKIYQAFLDFRETQIRPIVEVLGIEQENLNLIPCSETQNCSQDKTFVHNDVKTFDRGLFFQHFSEVPTIFDDAQKIMPIEQFFDIYRNDVFPNDDERISRSLFRIEYLKEAQSFVLRALELELEVAEYIEENRLKSIAAMEAALFNLDQTPSELSANFAGNDSDNLSKSSAQNKLGVRYVYAGANISGSSYSANGDSAALSVESAEATCNQARCSAAEILGSSSAGSAVLANLSVKNTSAPETSTGSGTESKLSTALGGQTDTPIGSAAISHAERLIETANKSLSTSIAKLGNNSAKNSASMIEQQSLSQLLSARNRLTSVPASSSVASTNGSAIPTSAQKHSFSSNQRAAYTNRSSSNQDINYTKSRMTSTSSGPSASRAPASTGTTNKDHFGFLKNPGGNSRELILNGLSNIPEEGVPELFKAISTRYYKVMSNDRLTVRDF